MLYRKKLVKMASEASESVKIIVVTMFSCILKLEKSTLDPRRPVLCLFCFFDVFNFLAGLIDTCFLGPIRPGPVDGLPILCQAERLDVEGSRRAATATVI